MCLNNKFVAGLIDLSASSLTAVAFSSLYASSAVAVLSVYAIFVNYQSINQSKVICNARSVVHTARI